MHLFTAHHVKLLNSCYPPTSALLTTGPDYSPNSHELSRLTYYASNHPGKSAKIGSELEKRLKLECRKAKTGNIRSRASLLISLSIFRSLATECRRDIALLSPSLIGSVDYTLTSIVSDLEVVARVASVFIAWTTYTNGHLIGADSEMTKNYLSILSQFATLGCYSLPDHETQNRTRLIGLSALTAALNSEALYTDIRHFGLQVSVILRPVTVVLFETAIPSLDEQSIAVKDAPASPYLAEFRTRPAIERRAASIHVHVDGDKGPSTSDVSDACLRALFSLLSHTNGAQLGYIMQSSFDNLDAMQGWEKLGHCCWYAQKTAEWSQYQYRYVVPTWLVERLLSQQDTPDVSPLLKSLIAMMTSVFQSPTPLINLSSSDIMSNLLSLLLRRISLSPSDGVLPALVECISSLGRHIYYSDQIQDLAGELISRLGAIEMQGVVQDKEHASESRASAIRCLLNSLTGLVRSANANDSTNLPEDTKHPSGLDHGKSFRESFEASRKEMVGDERSLRRTRVPPDIWQDTLSLLCDAEPSVRIVCANSLIYYIGHEMPKYGESTDPEGTTHLRRLAEGSFRQVHDMFPNISDAGSKFLNAVHAYIYILVTSPTLGLVSSIDLPLSTEDPSTGETISDADQHNPAANNDNLTPSKSNNRRSLTSHHGSRARKQSLVLKLLGNTPPPHSISAKASEEDYASLLKLITVIYIRLPMRGLFTGVPMLVALDEALHPQEADSDLLQRIIATKIVIAHAWLAIARVWKITKLITLAEQVIASLSALPDDKSSRLDYSAIGLRTNDVLSLLTTSHAVQEAFGTEQEGLMRRLTTKWTPEAALRDFENTLGYETSFRGGGVSPLLKISPALMHIENISLQSLTRSTRGLGVTDLREALEGRSSMSNPALGRPPSVSTLDHTSSVMGGEGGLRLSQTRSRSRAKKRSTPNGTGEVRDVLTRLGISKQNSNLLKATFPVLQKSG